MWCGFCLLFAQTRDKRSNYSGFLLLFSREFGRVNNIYREVSKNTFYFDLKNTS